MELSKLDSTTYNKSEFRNETIKEMVIKRNNNIIKFGQMFYEQFNELFGEYTRPVDCGDYKVRLIGNPHQPTLVFNNSFIISIFFKNFKVYFSTNFVDGEVLGDIGLNLMLDDEGIEQILEFLYQNISLLTVKPLYKVGILYNETVLFYSSKNEDGYNVFCNDKPNLFYIEEKAIEKIEELDSLGYEGVNLFLL